MNKPEIFTESFVMDKEYLVRYGEDISRYIIEQLGQRIAEKIYQECQKGERIISVGGPYSQDILEMNQVDTRMNVKIQELVRCKDCSKRGVCRSSNIWAVPPADDWFCADGNRRIEPVAIHHKFPLTPENIQDPNVSLNPDNLFIRRIGNDGSLLEGKVNEED